MSSPGAPFSAAFALLALVCMSACMRRDLPRAEVRAHGTTAVAVPASLPPTDTAAAGAFLDSMIVRKFGTALRDSAVRPTPPVGTPGYLPFALLQLGAVRAGVRIVALQWDPDRRYPFASPGERVALVDFRRGLRGSARVYARRAYRGGAEGDCEGNGVQFSGFAYVLDDVEVPVAAPEVPDSSTPYYQAIPATTTNIGARLAPPDVRAVFRAWERGLLDSAYAATIAAEPEIDTAALRAVMFRGPSGHTDVLDHQTLYELHGPDGRMYIASVTAYGDPSEHDANTATWLVLTDSAGRVTLRRSGRFQLIVGTGDVNGDGVDEVFFSDPLVPEGVLAWDGHRWVFPPDPPFVQC